MEFRLLGPVEVRSGGHALSLGTPRDRTILGILLVRPGTLIGIDQIIDELWPDDPPPDSRALVHGYVSRLRRGLRDGGGVEAAERLVTRKPGYLLRAHSSELDLNRFNELCADARAARRAGEPRQCLSLFRRAHQLWRGEPYADVTATPAIAATVARLTELRLTMLEDLFDVALELGQHADLTAELTELVAVHPLRERLIGQLIRAQHRAGRTADALNTFHEAKHRLTAELGIEPGAELVTLAGTLRNGGHERDQPATVPAAPHVPPPAQLPMDVTTFVGRTDELRRLLDPRGLPNTTTIRAIDGMAGVGKTALAIHAAHRLAGQYPDGQIFVDLHGFTSGVAPVDPAAALGHLLRSIGVPDDRLPGDLTARIALYRSHVADRSLLVLLDNAHDERQVRALFPASPRSLVLITSRRRLTGLDDAQTVSLDVLPTADATTLFTRLHTSDPPNTAVAEIVELSGRLPLAVRIVAARLRHRTAWSLDYLADRLRRRDDLSEFAAGGRGVAAELDLSYQDLGDAQQRMYRLLGLHPGADIDAEAAAALGETTVPGAARLLEDLLDAHLVQQHVPDRYRLHRLAHTHALTVCRSADTREARHEALNRLLDHYLSTAGDAVNLLYPHDSGALPTPVRPPLPVVGENRWAATWLDAELDNLVAVADAARHLRPSYPVRMSSTLQAHLRARAYYRAADTLHTRSLQAAKCTGDQLAELRSLIRIGHIRLQQHRHDLDSFEHALCLARRIGDVDGELTALYGLGVIHRAQGRYTRATDCHAEALDAARSAADRAATMRSLFGLGSVNRALGLHDRAADLFTGLRNLATAADDRISEVKACYALGIVNLALDDRDSALRHLDRAHNLARSVGFRAGELYTLVGMGMAARGTRTDLAVDHFSRARVLARHVDDRNAEFEATLGLGHTHHASGAHLAALADHQEAFDLAQALGQPEDEARAHHAVAAVRHVLGDDDQAREHWTRSLAILDDLGLAAIEEVDAAQIRKQLALFD